MTNPATTAQELYGQYHRTLISLLDKHAPEKLKQLKKKHNLGLHLQ